MNQKTKPRLSFSQNIAGPGTRSAGNAAGGSGSSADKTLTSAAASTQASRCAAAAKVPVLPLPPPAHARPCSSSSTVFTSSTGGVAKLPASSSKAAGEGFLLTSGVPVREGHVGASGAGDSDDESAPALASASSAELAAKAQAAKKAAEFKAANAVAVLPMDPATVPRPNVPRAAPTEAAGAPTFMRLRVHTSLRNCDALPRQISTRPQAARNRGRRYQASRGRHGEEQESCAPPCLAARVTRSREAVALMLLRAGERQERPHRQRVRAAFQALPAEF
jgi:hypothetical protein